MQILVARKSHEHRKLPAVSRAGRWAVGFSTPVHALLLLLTKRSSAHIHVCRRADAARTASLCDWKAGTLHRRFEMLPFCGTVPES